MKSLKKIWVRLKVRYDIKKEYFTLGLPALLALLFLAGSIVHLGFLELPGQEKATEEKTGAASFDSLQGLGEEEIEAQLLAMQAQKESRDEGAKSGEDKKKGQLDDVIILSVLIAIVPYSLDSYMEKRKLRRYEEEYSDFLFDMAELMRGGIDPFKAVKELASTDLGRITKYVKIAKARMSYGKSFDYSMRQMAVALRGKLIQKYTDILIQASYTGGNVSELIMKASDDMKKFLLLEREKEGSLKMYIIIMYMAQALLLMIAGTFIFYVLPSLQDVNLGMFLSTMTSAKLSKDVTVTYIFHIIMINAFFVGLISGKLSSGTVKAGLKHSAILIAGSYLAFILVLTPSSALGEKLVITAVSFPEKGIVGLPTPEPVVFKVTDAAGNPRANVTLEFSVDGPSTGKLKKKSGMTDEEGLVEVEPSLGILPGKYSIEARFNENEGSAEIDASGG
ncbi:MAG: type II secretion system F family protein [Candidatus Altiarchaeota archaeon]|nr:type II secretion system F family protein [Candidatus Altiarchaeota archaeon]